MTYFNVDNRMKLILQYNTQAKLQNILKRIVQH